MERLRLGLGETAPGGFDRTERVLLWSSVAVAAALRLGYQHERAFMGDECGTVIHIERSVGYLLSHYERWLTMNYFLVLEKAMAGLFSASLAPLSAIPLLAGIAVVPLTALLAARLVSKPTALVAALLVAVNPFLVEMSGFVRAYSLLAALSLVTLIGFLRWLERPSARRGVALAVACFFTVLIHPNGVYTVVSVLALAGLAAIRSGERSALLQTLRHCVLPVLAAMAAVALAYSGFLAAMLEYGRAWHSAPPSSVAYLKTTFAQYFSGSTAGIVTIVFLSAGLLGLRARPQAGVLLLTCIAVPVLLVSAQGLVHRPHAFARFHIASLPLLLIVLARGVGLASEVLARAPWREGLRAGLALLLIASWLPNLLETFERRDQFSKYREAGEFVLSEHRAGDAILSEGITNLHLLPYLPPRAFRHYTLEEFLKAAQRPGGPASRLFYLGAAARGSRFSAFEADGLAVAVYPMPDDRAALEPLLADLTRHARRRRPGEGPGDVQRRVCALQAYLHGEADPARCGARR